MPHKQQKVERVEHELKHARTDANTYFNHLHKYAEHSNVTQDISKQIFVININSFFDVSHIQQFMYMNDT